MLHKYPPLVVLVALCLHYSIAGQPEIDSYTDRSSFTSAIDNQKILDFEGVAANSGFVHFNREGRFTTAGIEFRPGGGNRFGPGPIIIVGPWHQAGPALETTSGAKMVWRPPNQAGDAYLHITLPSGTTAVASDVWAVQPYTSPVEVVVATSDGGSRTVTINTPARPAAGFVGFTSSSSITSVRFIPAKGQTGLIIDNFSFGRRNDSAVRRSAVVTSPAPGAETGSTESPLPAKRTPVSPGLPASDALTPQPFRPDVTSASGPPSTSGTIAYTRGSTELRLISPDGTNDRRLWTHPEITEALGLFELAWRPDGKELAFSSGHDSSASLYHADVYGIRPDGSGLRKITNAPLRSEYARYRKGTVTLTIQNGQSAAATSGVFIVHIAGAEPQQVLVPAGTTKNVVFNSVADFGKEVQAVVAVFGQKRWFNEGVDVVAGKTVASPPLGIGAGGTEMLGAFRPTWRSDGSRISYRDGFCVVRTAPSNPTPGVYFFEPMFRGKNPGGACTWDWGPTPATANQIIYTDNKPETSDIYRMTEGGTHPGTKLTSYSDLPNQLLLDLQWMPDALGLIYSTVNKMRDSSNIYRYDFATKRTTQVTSLKNEFAREFGISPDGSSIVFERCKSYQEDSGCDLWVAGTDGSSPRLLTRNGLRPAWGR